MSQKRYYLSLLLLVMTSSIFAHGVGSNLKPMAFGPDQTIVDLEKLVWSPLEVEGLAPGAEIALIRGDLGKDHSESFLRLPPGYVVRQHTHTSDELYVWVSGAFTLISDKGKEKVFNGPAYISFPGNAPTHALKCGDKEPCVLYLRYSRPFDIHYQ